MIEVDIETAIFDKAISIASALSLPIEFPNVKINPPETGAYLRVDHFRNRNINWAWGDGTIFQGIMQIMVVQPADIGTVAGTTIAAQIVALLDKGTTMISGAARVVIEEKPSVLSPVQDGHKTEIPVSVPYRCYP